MSVILAFLYEFWNVSLEMAPFLIFGFVFAGFLSVLMPRSWVQRHLAGKGTFPVFKAALIGIPLPLCSCGVIPVSAGLRRQGASPSAVLSFLISTPQTGIDSILVTGGMLGWFFAFYRTLLALISGFVAGVAGNVFLLFRKEEEKTSDGHAEIKTPSSTCCCPGEEGEISPTESPSVPTDNVSCCQEAAEEENCCSQENASPPPTCCEHDSEMTLPKKKPRNWRSVMGKMLRFSFVQIPNDLALSLLFGLVASALVAALVPDDFFHQRLGSLAEGGILGMLLMVVVSVPLYVCATASVPLAAVLLQKGVSAGMVLVFLMSGPATNAATISTVTTVLGKKAAVIYLSSIILIAIIGGQLLDLFYQSTTFSPGKLSVEMLPWSAKIPSVVVLFGMIAFGLWNRVRRAGDGTEEHGDDEEKESCCRD